MRANGEIKVLSEADAGLATQGNVAEPLLTYEQLRLLLREELGVLPGAATEALHRQLLQRHGGQRGALVRELQTVLFTDIVSSTARLAALGDHAWRELSATSCERLR